MSLLTNGLGAFGTYPPANQVLTTAGTYGPTGVEYTPSYSLAAHYTDPGQAYVAAGTTYLFAGTTETGTYAGASFPSEAPANWLDSITIEAGVNLRQAIAAILSACGGVVAGAGTGTVVIKGGNTTTSRITATTDSSGNRTSVTLNLPT